MTRYGLRLQIYFNKTSFCISDDRTAGLGSSSFWARVGPMIAPFIVELKTYGQQVPLVVFGVIALLAGFLD